MSNTLILSSLYDLCYRANSYTSFSPEKRAEYLVKEYSEMLTKDLEELGENCGNYKEKFIAKFTDWMHAKSRCISTMITGPANFPVRRAQKANDSERNKCDAFYHWREKYFTAVNRVPTPSPEVDLINATLKVSKMKLQQIELKQINAAVRKSKLTDINEILTHLEPQDFDPNFLGCLKEYRGKWKIPAYILTNLNARIKSHETKTIVMENRICTKNNWQDIIFWGGRVTIENDRVCIFHDEKPPKDIILEIKQNGFRWSPNWVCWCRKHTGNAIFVVKTLSFVKAAETTEKKTYETESL